jgi:hypothetical protein
MKLLVHVPLAKGVAKDLIRAHTLNNALATTQAQLHKICFNLCRVGQGNSKVNEEMFEASTRRLESFACYPFCITCLAYFL